MKIYGILNGPNINRLGLREPEVYGKETLPELSNALDSYASDKNVSLQHFQSNHEGELIDQLHQWADSKISGVIFNPAAYTHNSIALQDAISSVNYPVIEIHISNIHKRESFRHQSMTAPACVGSIAGLGTHGYKLALEHLIFLNA